MVSVAGTGQKPWMAVIVIHYHRAPKEKTTTLIGKRRHRGSKRIGIPADGRPDPLVPIHALRHPMEQRSLARPRRTKSRKS